ncbi:MAG: DUF4412 domain-containing protein, partial [Blastocatellia bacterium]
MLNIRLIKPSDGRSSIRLSVLFVLLSGAAMLVACGALNSSSTNSSGGSSSGGGSASSKGSSSNDFEGVIVMKSHLGGVSDKPIVEDQTYYMKGTHLRIESSSNLGGLIHSKTAMIEDFDTGKIIALYPERKEYMNMNLGDFAGAAEAENSGDTLTRTGQKETIAGYTCEDYHLIITGENAETADICVTKGLGNYMSGFAKFFTAKTRAKLESNPMWKDFFSGGMFPLRQKIVTADGTS